MNENIQLSIVIPCHNEDLVLDELHRRVTAAAESAVNTDYEIVLINDGSTDRTWAKIEELCENDIHVVGIDLSRNFGHQIALSAGLEICKGQRILVLDADLQDPPELLPEMMNALDNGADVAYGQRISREGETHLKKVTASLFYRVLWRLTDTKIPLDTGDFRLMSRRVCDHLIAMPEKQRFIRGMVAWLGYKQVPIQYNRRERIAGVSKYPFRKMVSFALDAITSFSVNPIRFSAYLALIFAVTTTGLIIYIILGWLTNTTVPGWASLGVIITSIGAGQFLILSIMGEYIGRIYIESKNRPLFLIKEIKTGNSDPRKSSTQGEG
jgi:dolichol-phosphate mannosyltransferase